MDEPLPQGSTIGILGGGQLGRMTAIAAARLGYRSHVYAPDEAGPAAQVTAAQTVASYDDDIALQGFLRSVDVVTVETEHIPPHVLERAEDIARLHPSAKTVRVCQDREIEKTFVNAAGADTTRWVAVRPGELEDAIADFGLPCIVKTSTGGYDGHGQMKISSPEDIATAMERFGRRRLILEEPVDFSFEASVIVARSRRGASISYPLVRNDHRDHILWRTTVPAGATEAVEARCEEVAAKIARELDLVGLLAVELFITEDGRALVNELAPRPHNSGHWSLDASATSQFEQLVRAIAGLPLGATDALYPARMTNLLGDEIHRRDELCGKRFHRVHIYGKRDVRPGRKMGHYTELLPD